MKQDSSNTGKQQVKRKLPKEAEAHKFKPGDPRINRNGRPRKSDELRKYILDKLDAPALDKEGKQIVVYGEPQTNMDMMFRRMLSDPKQYREILDRAFGKVKDEVEQHGQVTLNVVYRDRD